LEFRQLRYFACVADEGSFTSAATVLGVAQPALSIQIGKLEKEIGHSLFNRHARGVSLTASGIELAKHAKLLIEAHDNILASLRPRTPQKVTVKLGLPPIVSRIATVSLIEAARQALPHVTLEIFEFMSGTLNEYLIEGKLDVGLMHNIFGNAHPNTELLVAEPIYVGTAKTSTLSLPSELPVSALANLPLVTPTEKNFGRTIIERLARDNGFRLNVVAEINSLSQMKAMADKGNCALVGPLNSFTYHGLGHFNLSKVAGTARAWQTNLVTSNAHPLPHEAQEVAHLVSTIVRSLVASGAWFSA
jgi:LysR family transcriptional regulator, nitrogen assimilation regulatory protein